MTLDQIRSYFEQDRFAQLAGITIDAFDENSAVCSVALADKHLNALQSAQGGLIYTLADLAFAVAANAGGRHTVTLNSTINFLSPGKGKKLTAAAHAKRAGRSTSVYEVSITDETGALVAFATFTGFVQTNTVK